MGKYVDRKGYVIFADWKKDFKQKDKWKFETWNPKEEVKGSAPKNELEERIKDLLFEKDQLTRNLEKS